MYVGNETSDFELELTWMRDFDRDYDLGDCEFHLAFRTADFDQAHKLHEEMGCICFENPDMGFILSKIPMDIGWRSYRKDKSFLSESNLHCSIMIIKTGLQGKIHLCSPVFLHIIKLYFFYTAISYFSLRLLSMLYLINRSL